MIELKKDGFVLVEAIVVISFILGIITFIFTNMLPIIGEYEKIDKYDEIVDKYNVHIIRKMLLKDNDCKVKNILEYPTDKYFYVFEGTEICRYLQNINYCTKLLSRDYLDVKNIIIAKYNVTELKSASNEFNRNLSEYINLMPKYDKLESTLLGYAKTRRLIVEFNDGSISNIELLMSNNPTCGGTGC